MHGKPGMIFVCYLGSGESYNYPAASLILQLISILIGLALIETGLCWITGGFAAFCCSFFCLAWVMGIHLQESARIGYITHINHLLLGGELPNKNWISFLDPRGDHPVILADLPWVSITFMILFSITSMICVMLSNRMALQPSHSNRETGFRFALMVAYALFTYWFGCKFYTANWNVDHHGSPWGYWSTSLGMSFLGMAGGFGAYFGSLPQRVRKQIPKDKWRRWLAYPFFSGPNSRILWCGGLLMVNAIIYCIVIGFSYWKVAFGLSFLLLALYLYNTELIRKNAGLERQNLLTKCALSNLYWVFPLICIIIIDDNFLNNRFVEEVICFPLGVTLLLIMAWRSRKWFLKHWGNFKPI